MTLLSFADVSKSFPGVRALDRVSFTVEAGEIHALVGENGAGKSTLIKILGGAYVPDEGEVLLDGEPLPRGDPLAVARRGVRIIYQELTLVPELTAAENVFLGRERLVPRSRYGVGGGGVVLARREMNDETQRVLDELGADVRSDAKVRTLSVAQQQMVEIARALGSDRAPLRRTGFGGRGREPSGVLVLVLDEPTSSLPSSDATRLLEMLRGLAKRGLGIVYISHRLEEVFAIAHRVTVLRDGRVTGSAPAKDLDRATLIRLMVGRDLEDEFPKRGPGGLSPHRGLSPSCLSSPEGPVPHERHDGDSPLRQGTVPETILEVRSLSSPGRFTAVDLTVRRGEIVGLTGLVGAGRTSVGLALFGALASSGSILLDGSAFSPRSPSAALAAGVAYVTEDRKAAGIFAALDVGANVTMTSLPMFARFGVLDRGREQAAAGRAVREFDVRSTSLAQRAGTLSGGNQQKLLLARFLLEKRKLLILDEPTRGVDIGAKAEIYALIDRLAREGLGVLFISSELPELLGMADRIVVMKDGRTVGDLARGVATEERIMELATAEHAT